MKLKNNIVIFAAYFIGNIYGFNLERQSNKANDVEDCHVICCKENGSKIIDLKKDACLCPQTIDNDVTMLNNPKLVPLNHNLERNMGQKEKEGKKVKRQTIQDLIKKKNKIDRKPIKTVTLFSTEKPSSKFKLNKQIQKSEIKSRTSGLWSNNKQSSNIQELRERLKGLRERMSIKPRFQSRGSFPSDEKSKNIMKQITDTREKLIKTLRSNSAIGKDLTPLKERVGSINHLQNRIDNIESSIKEKMKGRTEERKSKIVGKETTDAKERVGAIQKLSTTTEKPKPTTSAIPEIVLGKTESIVSKTETVIQKIPETKLMVPDNIESSTKKAETVSVALEKIKEKQKELVMKMKDSVAKNKSKQLQILNDSSSA